MSYKLLSFLMACCFAVGVFIVNQSLQNPQNGQAQASIHALGGAYHGVYADGQKREIRRQIAVNPNYIYELHGLDVYQILDTPEMIRRDLPTIVWQYRNDHCVLDLYFTSANGLVSKSPVVHYEARARNVRDGDAAAAKAHCLSDLVSSQGNLISLLDFERFYKAGAAR